MTLNWDAAISVAANAVTETPREYVEWIVDALTDGGELFAKVRCEHGKETAHRIGPEPDCGRCKGEGWINGYSGSDAYFDRCPACSNTCYNSGLKKVYPKVKE